MYENKQEEQTAVLAAIDTGEYDAQRSMDELEELAKSAGAKVMGRVIQKKDRPDDPDGQRQGGGTGGICAEQPGGAGHL